MDPEEWISSGKFELTVPVAMLLKQMLDRSEIIA
jgi:hypothetical protein